MTIYDFMLYCREENFQHIKIWNIDLEEYMFDGEYYDVDELYDFCELQSFEVENNCLILNI